MPSHLQRFGLLYCIRCIGSHEFVSYDPECKHITDAMCSECGYIYGRVDQVDDLAWMKGPDAPKVLHRQPVISDAMAAEAVARLGHGVADTSPAAARLLPPPPAPWRPGKFAVPSGAELLPPSEAPAAPPPAARAEPRSPASEPVRARSDEFMRSFREQNGGTAKTS